MKTAVIYTRVSTQKQADEGISLEAQLAKAKSWCEFNGYEDIHVFSDAGISGKQMSTRPGLLQALNFVCKKKATLVVYSLSRLARSTRDALAISERLEKAGADLASLSEQLDTTTAAGKMVFRLLSVLAEFERDLISERTKNALSHKRMLGQKTGGSVPYGFDKSMDESGYFLLVENPSEQVIVRLMYDAHKMGNSYNQIAKDLNAGGVASKNGGDWSSKVVRDVIARHEKGEREKLENS